MTADRAAVEVAFDAEMTDERTGEPHDWWHLATRDGLIVQAVKLVSFGLSVEAAVDVVISCYSIAGGEYGN